MKGEQQEERIPNFIGNAVIILTAAHLGCEVEMLATAQEVWRTKRLPEAVLLGMYEKAACDAVSAVRKRGLAEQADRLGEIFTGRGISAGRRQYIKGVTNENKDFSGNI